jgi:SEC-C motif-containing protein
LSIAPTDPLNDLAAHETGAVAEAPVFSGTWWNLFPNGLLVLERPLGPAGPSRLLVSQLEACLQVQCTCREVTMRAVDLELAAPPASMEEFTALLAGREPVYALIELDLGQISPLTGDANRPPLKEEWLTFLNAQPLGELLDRLHARWLNAKSLKPRNAWDSIDWTKRDPAELIIWDEIFPDGRSDHFLTQDGHLYLATEQYCSNSRCTCNEARIVFTELTGRGHSRHLGSIRVQLPSGVPEVEEEKRRDRRTLQVLWQAYQRRHDVTARLSSRRRRIHELGDTLPKTLPAAAAPAAPKVGRNDPCPCGSGLKHKRCCLDKA